MKSLRVLSLFLFFILISFYSSGQNGAFELDIKKFSKENRIVLDSAELFFEDGKYLEALALYEKLDTINPNEDYIKYMLGMCYLKKEDAYDKAVEFLKPLAEKTPNVADVKFHLGTAYHLTFFFDEAIKEFEEYMTQDILKEQKTVVQRLIENCINGKELLKNPIDVTITNIGGPVNTKGSEYVPVLSSDELTMIFTYRGENSIGGRIDDVYFEDVYITHKEGGKWGKPTSIADNLNGDGHDANIALSADGQKLFIYKDPPETKADIYLSELEGEDWSRARPLKGNVNTPNWEGSASLTSDGKTLYFTSDKPDGLGGRDIYTATLKENGEWGNVQNIGSQINTKYDDDAPFIHPNGKVLVFSSKGHNSMGSYDIFYSELIDGSWSKPVNMGFPINSPDRDIYYVLSADGKKGYFSSGRPGGKGMQDIYSVYPGLTNKTAQVAMIKGKVTLNNESALAKIIVVNKGTQEEYGVFTSNASTGEYLINVPSGEEYELTYQLRELVDEGSLENGVIKKQTVVAGVAGEYSKIKMMENFYTKTYPKEKRILGGVDTTQVIDEEIAEIAEIELITNITDSSRFESLSISEKKELTYQERIVLYGEKEVEKLFYKVQIAAYGLPENFNYDRLKALGKIEHTKVEVESTDEGEEVKKFTVFTVGGTFKTLAVAEIVRIKAISMGQTDAFITGYYKGKRVYLETLIKEGILSK